MKYPLLYIDVSHHFNATEVVNPDIGKKKKKSTFTDMKISLSPFFTDQCFVLVEVKAWSSLATQAQA